MRKGTKMLVTASVFAVAMNANACVYGPPPEDYDFIPPTVTTAVELHQPTLETVEPATWYKVTMGRYAVIRMLSVPGDESLSDKQDKDVVCGIEVLSAYNVEENLNMISELLIPAKDTSLFSEGDVLFVELDRMVYINGEGRYTIKRGDYGPVYIPYTENQLNYSDISRWGILFELTEIYNFEIRSYRHYLDEGAEYYMPFDFRTFEEGMTTEETALFFEDLKKAKADYEVVLERLRKEMTGGSENE